MPVERNQQVTIGQNHQSAKAFPDGSRLLRQWLHLQAIIFDPRTSKSDIAVAQCLLDYDQLDKGAFPSFETIARRAGISRRMAAYSVERLVSAGYFTRESGGGRRRSNTYRPIYKTVQSVAPFQANKQCNPLHPLPPKTVQSGVDKRCNGLHPNPLNESKEGNSIDLRGSSEAQARTAAWAVKRGYRLTSVSQIDVNAAVALGLLTAEEVARW